MFEDMVKKHSRNKVSDSGNYFLLDTETGGRSKECSLLSLYGMILDKHLCVIDTIDLKIKPNNNIYHFTAEALGVNKINIEEHQKSAISLQEAAELFSVFVSKHAIARKLVAIGHNVRFDVKFAKHYLLPEWDKYFSYRQIDTASIALFLQQTGNLSEEINCSLDSIMNELGVSIDDADRHTAKGDAYATRVVYQHMLKLLEPEDY